MSPELNRRRLVGGSLAVLAGLAEVQLGLADETPPAPSDPRGGLGLTGKEWVALWGEPDAEVEGRAWKYEYTQFGVVVRLLYLEDDQEIIQFGVTPVVPIAREGITPIVERFLPEDATVIGEYPRPSGPGSIQIYNSPWLAERFLAINDSIIDNWFPGGNPGDFITIYQEAGGGEVENVVVALGNNP